MFWSCFSYDYKGPYHIWKAESATEKTAAARFIKEVNKHCESIIKAEWKLLTAIHQTGLHNKGGQKPRWHFTEADGKLVRHAKQGGID